MINLTKRMKEIEINENENLIKDFKVLLKANKQTIVDILSKEGIMLKSNYQYDSLVRICDKFEDYKGINIKKYSSIGTAVCVTNGDTYFVLELILKAFLTKTRMIFATESYMFSINTYLVEIAKKVLEKYNISREAVNIVRTSSYKDVVKVVDNIDCIVVNKDYETYKNIEELVDIKVIYSDYGNINVYAESKEFENEIENLCECAKNEDKDIFLTRMDDIREYLNNMNNNFIFYSVVIYTKNVEKCTYFVKKIKAKNVYINKNPFEYIDVDFPEDEFLYQKKIIY